MRVSAAVFVCLSLLLGYSTESSGATWIVEADGTGDAATIQAAIDGAGVGDTILVTDGTFTGPGNRDVDFGGKAVVLMSENGPDFTVIDVEGSFSELHRAFLFKNGEGVATMVIGVTVRNGYAPFETGFGYAGGAAVCVGASPSFQNCVFENGSTPSGSTGGGAGVACKDGAPEFTDCTFRMNRAERGGGVVCDNASPVFNGCTFSENEGMDGGGAHCRNGSSPSFVLCTFEGNTGYASTNSGGGIYIVSSSPTIEQCTFSENRTSHGGGIYGLISGAVVEDCVFTMNAATWGAGGGVHFEGTGTPTITGCTFTQNTAYSDNSGGAYGGAAIACTNNANALISGNTITDNTAARLDGGTGRGGGLFCEDADPTIADNEIARNQALGIREAYGGGIYLERSDAVITGNTISENSVDSEHTAPQCVAQGGALYIESSNPVIGGASGSGNTFAENSAWIGNDVYMTGGTTVVDAQYNTFHIYPVSEYYVHPLDEFDTSNGSGVYAAITEDVTVSPAGSDRIARSATASFQTVHAALGRVLPTAGNPVTIHLGPGTYSPSQTGEVFPLQMMSYLSIVGSGFDESILDAEGTNRVIYCEELSSCVISGLTIRGGRAGSGAGIYCKSASPRIECNKIEFNEGSWGGGIACFDGAAPEIVDNVVADNTFLSTSYFALLGGGVFARNGSSPYIGNNLFLRNRSGYGGAIACDQNSLPEIANNTFCENEADQGGAMSFWNSSSATIRNDIVWGNTAGSDPSISVCCGSSPNVSYSDVEGGWSGAGSNNIDADPGFDASGRFYLMAGSPCIDGGDPSAAYNDIEGEPGLAKFPSMGSLRNDMGMYGGPGAKDIFEVEQEALQLAMDIKPGSCPNPLNSFPYTKERPNGKQPHGVLPVALLGTADFDVSSVVASSVRLEGVVPLRYSIEDVSSPAKEPCACNGGEPDGHMDLSFKFGRAEIVEALQGLTGEVTLTLVGELEDGTPFEAQDCVTVHDREDGDAPIPYTRPPQKTALKTAMPTPFNPTTRISYVLEETAHVVLDVFNVRGDRVDTLVDGVVEGGEHVVVWNAENLPSGVYFYRLRVGNFTETRKAVLLK